MTSESPNGPPAFPRALVVEDPKFQTRELKPTLEKHGFRVEGVASIADADARLRENGYDIVLVSSQTPGFQGAAQLQEWRAEGVSTRIVVLTPNDRGPEPNSYLSAGADVCLGLKVQHEELLAWMRALLRRRAKPEQQAILRVHDLELNLTTRTVRRAGKTINVTRREFTVLELLVRNCGKIVTRDAIWQHLYGNQPRGTSNIIDVYIRYLRSKIDQNDERPLLLTRWGQGYMLRAEQ